MGILRPTEATCGDHDALGMLRSASFSTVVLTLLAVSCQIFFIFTEFYSANSESKGDQACGKCPKEGGPLLEGGAWIVNCFPFRLAQSQISASSLDRSVLPKGFSIS